MQEGDRLPLPNNVARGLALTALTENINKVFEALHALGEGFRKLSEAGNLFNAALADPKLDRLLKKLRLRDRYYRRYHRRGLGMGLKYQMHHPMWLDRRRCMYCDVSDLELMRHGRRKR